MPQSTATPSLPIVENSARHPAHVCNLFSDYDVEGAGVPESEPLSGWLSLSKHPSHAIGLNASMLIIETQKLRTWNI